MFLAHLIEQLLMVPSPFFNPFVWGVFPGWKMSRPLLRGVSGGVRISGKNDSWDDSHMKEKTEKEDLDKIRTPSDHTYMSFRFPFRFPFLDNSPSKNSFSGNGFASDPFTTGSLRSRHKLTMFFLKLSLVAIVILALTGSFLWTISITSSSRGQIIRGNRRIQEQLVSDLWDIGELSLGASRFKEFDFCPEESENHVPCFNVTESLALGIPASEEHDRHCSQGLRQNCLFFHLSITRFLLGGPLEKMSYGLQMLKLLHRRFFPLEA